MSKPIRFADSPAQFVYPLKVAFHDVDSMNIVWHGRYVKYFELARCELLESFNYDYVAMRDSGFAWPVVDMRIKYVKPLRFNQQVEIKCWVKEWEHRLKIEYLVVDAETQEKLTSGYTIQVAVDMKTEEMCLESPAVLFERLGVES